MWQDILIKNNRQGDKNKTVRRAFSAKVPNISPTSSLFMKADAIKKESGQCLDVGKKFTMRSLSQPSGLDRIPRIGEFLYLYYFLKIFFLIFGIIIGSN